MENRIPAEELNRLVVLLQGNRYAELEQQSGPLIERYPADGRGWQLLGLSFLGRARNQEALPLLKRASELMPRNPAIWDHLGLAHSRLGEYGQADACFRQSVAIQPQAISAWVNWSSNALSAGDFQSAEELAQQALRIGPNSAESHLNLGNALVKRSQARPALAYFERAIELKPDLLDAYLSLGMAHEQLGDNDAAIASYRRATECRPDYWPAYSNRLFLLTHDGKQDPAYVFAEHKAFGERLESPLKSHWIDHANVRDKQRRLRVGFVSGDLRAHAAASFVEPLFQALDRERFELVVYSSSPFEDQTSARIKGNVDGWVNVNGVSDDAVAQRIRADGIDILADLSGHTAYNRLPVFARKPAPIQVSWLGYPGTTGLTAIDYRPVSRYGVPPGLLDDQFTEKLVFVSSWSPFKLANDAPEVNELPALRRGYLTFGSFNRQNKLGEPVVALWSKVLQAVPGSRMLIGSIDDAAMRALLTERFARFGIAAERLEFHPRLAMADYLRLYHEIDIVLDSFPYTGGTTSNLALWMGVPVVTLVGKTLPQRQGAGVMCRTGLNDWVASNEEEYVRQARNAAGDLPALAELRRDLRGRMSASPSRSQANVARAFETAFQIMWERWCDGLPPESFEVKQ